MRSLTILFCFAISSWLGAQNLVPNGSFEDYTDCPPYFGFASNATGWQNLYTQSADYFNACHISGVVGVPLNQFGDQYPAHGNAYMGMATYAYNQPEYREMVGIQLIEPLQVGEPICLAFKLAVGGFGTSVGNSAGYTCKGIGMKFFTELPTAQYIYDYPNSAALYLDEVPTDTAVWYQVEGSYVPDSAYTYVVVGNFFSESLIQPTIQDSLGINATDWAYAFIDDVRASIDLNYCSLELGLENAREQPPLVHPNPFSQDVFITSSTSAWLPTTFTCFDLTGRIVAEGRVDQAGQQGHITLPDLPTGTYLLQLVLRDGTLLTKRVQCVAE